MSSHLRIQLSTKILLDKALTEIKRVKEKHQTLVEDHQTLTEKYQTLVEDHQILLEEQQEMIQKYIDKPCAFCRCEKQKKAHMHKRCFCVKKNKI
tara:strand:+ start:3064 stop:3348 length:285 start_codon:yes stop_codon:yes gene_type:complete